MVRGETTLTDPDGKRMEIKMLDVRGFHTPFWNPQKQLLTGGRESIHNGHIHGWGRLSSTSAAIVQPIHIHSRLNGARTAGTGRRKPGGRTHFSNIWVPTHSTSVALFSSTYNIHALWDLLVSGGPEDT
jgi:hypothetical protein